MSAVPKGCWGRGGIPKQLVAEIAADYRRHGARECARRHGRSRQSIHGDLVLAREECPLVGVAESRRVRIAVDGDHVQVALARGAQEPELRRPGA